jgi:chemotaxis protein MotB
MALARNRRRERTVDYWPGFVDALSTLLIAVMFLLTVFVVGQFILSREISGRDEVMSRLNSQINELTQLLALEKGSKQDLEDSVANLQASLATAEGERSRLQSLLSAGAGGQDAAQQRIGSLTKELDDQKQMSDRAMSQVELLNQQIAALRNQIAAIEVALQASEQKDQSSQTKIADLGRRLNVALAARVQELNRYRSDFFGRLREILSDRENIRIVGDRFVFQSEVLFPSVAPISIRMDRPRWASSPRRCSTSPRKSRRRSTGCCASMATPTTCRWPAPADTATTGSSRQRARFRWSSS